jgi:hypothetical protein
MTDNAVVTEVRRATPADSLDHLIEGAYTRATTARGGHALLAQLWGSAMDLEALRSSVAVEVEHGHVWIAKEGTDVIAGTLVRDGCVQVIWVVPARRRQRVATTILRALLESDAAPIDALALPGDRATKSLYESVGWKARLLTMRGA